MATKNGNFELVLIRHGRSEWNDLNKFTGWYDCALSEAGRKEAANAGRLLQQHNFKFDYAFTSYLKRAIRTLYYVLEETDQMHVPIQTAWELNERHYGDLQGKDKQEAVEKFGKDTVLKWRRSYDIPPPACDESSPHHPRNNEKYANIPAAAKINTESLKTTLERVVPFWKSDIAPKILSGQRVVVAAHGNSLRALVKYLDNIPENVIAELNIPTGVPLVYELDKDLKPVKHPEAMAPLQGRYIGDQDVIRAAIEGVKSQTK